MGTHRRPRQRATGGGRVRTAATITLAGAATATGLGGTGHADPQPTAAQVRAKVDKLYQEAEVATEKYNGAKEKADAAEQRLEELRDEAARKEDRLNTAREALGSVAAAQYRSGGLDPALQLALSSDPDRYLDGAAFVERAGSRQTAEVGRVRKELREVERLRGAARVEVASLKSRRAELKRHRETVTGKLESARRLLSRLTTEERVRVGGGTGDHASRAASPGSREGLSAAAQAPDSRAAAAPWRTPTRSSAAPTCGARPARTPSTARASPRPPTAPPGSRSPARPTPRSTRAAASHAPNSSRATWSSSTRASVTSASTSATGG
ncbi:outer membrane murein-binding lipoprotein Lpp [Streptomyces ambofaciens]